MCNIAGYVGEEPAAPILLEMIQAQEGLAGGYYSGLAVLTEGEVRHCKVVGDCTVLRESLGGMTLPGRVGVAHSRSNSGGDSRWAHPFVVGRALAYVANGSVGCFEDELDLEAEARRLKDAGHRFTAVAEKQVGRYPRLPDGRCVHMSDVMAHAIANRMGDGAQPLSAIEDAFLCLPSEIAGLFITYSHSAALFGARFNMPVCVGRDGRGAYVASSPCGFPETVREWRWIPPWSVAEITFAQTQVRPLGDGCTGGRDDIDRREARECILELLADGEAATCGRMIEAVGGLAVEDGPVVACDPTYEVLHELESEGRVRRDRRRVAGPIPGVPAATFEFTLA